MVASVKFVSLSSVKVMEVGRHRGKASRFDIERVTAICRQSETIAQTICFKPELFLIF
jgi:hypothetical protein